MDQLHGLIQGGFFAWHFLTRAWCDSVLLSLVLGGLAPGEVCGGVKLLSLSTFLFYLFPHSCFIQDTQTDYMVLQAFLFYFYTEDTKTLGKAFNGFGVHKCKQVELMQKISTCYFNLYFMFPTFFPHSPTLEILLLSCKYFPIHWRK